MNRIFGYGNKKSHDQLMKESNQAMTQAQQGLQSRISQLDTQISQINMQLQTIQKRLSNVRSPAGQKPLRAQALKLLNKRKKLEQMRESLDNQDWSMTQSKMMSDTLANTMVSVNALKQSNMALKSQYGKIDIDKLEDMQDEMIDLIEKGEELQNALSMNTNSLDVDDIDEDELDAELDALAEDDLMGFNVEGNDLLDTGAIGDGVPSYLSNAIPQFIDEEPPNSLTNDKELEHA
ncbi:similar to Saccharomyces cerevisiae YDR486C VPS60 Cytoplasmic and vacuolar membrane protein involved in late endosome to vacuole transport [Maudiozyma saulgeensis]|uniref:Similar to Saccharomyces cerevisiae YDR486C VPS60 Cytoplasmic and vacuolar membrane protein involved in late endosome to vacuole transport n=1 Tax=Maudiozyma saulgeensis TaxID=1789683 RepID=A0A1X7R268_9SACH|nr:similar to Saccharomyces cerevisiae YDR486C VPS60 Cytoplasmic and vacuolar membrane protein involved in late endosome to vacuole transport [Kazachstania saulgeensis]